MKTMLVVAMIVTFSLVLTTVSVKGLYAQAAGTTSAQQPTPKARIDAAFQAAARASIPASLLESKVQEGEAKKVPPDRLATAVETRLRFLMRASQTMKRARVESISKDDLAVAGDALETGVTENALISVCRAAPLDQRVVAVAILADLVRLGNESGPASSRVNSALVNTTALAKLYTEVLSQLRLGGLTGTLDATGIIKIK
jgi:hypothetical protein